MKKLVVSLLLSVIISVTLYGQTTKKRLDHDAIAKWNRITETVISPDGEWISYKLEPWQGDSEVMLYTSRGEKVKSYSNSTEIKITADSKFLICKTVSPYETVRQLKIQKTKKEDMPGEILNIYNLKKPTNTTIDNIIGYKIPDNWGGWIAYSFEPEKADGKEDKSDLPEKKPTKKESSKNGYTLNLVNLEDGNTLTWPFVTSYQFASKSKVLVFVSSGDDGEFKAGIYRYDIVDGNLSNIYESEGDFKSVIIADEGDIGAFILNEDPKSNSGIFDIYKWESDRPAKKVVSKESSGIPSGWIVSPNKSLQFNNNRDRLFFGLAPATPEKDTLRLDDEYPDVDIWHGTESKLHTVQVLDKNRDANKAYLSVYHFKTGNIVQLETVEIPDVNLINRGDNRYVYATTNVPYALQAMWESSPLHYDIYLIDVESGQSILIKKDIRAAVQASPEGNYLAWYNYSDSSFYSYNIANSREYRLTSPETVAVADELNDIPNPPNPYRQTGWLKNDAGLLLNDRYDIWKIDLEGRTDPINITINGRETSTTYSYISFDREARSIDLNSNLFLTGQNEKTRESYYYSWDGSKPSKPIAVNGGKYALSRPQKAKEGKTVVYTKSTFDLFPDLLVSDLKFKKSVKISDANPQQPEYNWGTAEVVRWTSLDGKSIEGLLFKPADFDPSKKYPMIVNFYEKSSQGLFNYRTPELHRSTIDYHYYTSNGYLIFNPDVYYEDGYPGESAFNCVMPGITALIEKGFVDKDKIGAQGHSWGGYQVAYLATRTDLFAAIESGAPVVNMFSAYGGIRWWSGLNRSFQYEHTQSRIGATIWESPLRYLENSPLFTMDKVTTPILIMHNDSDGHVPWYQGIEYFIALRRLQKPVWMLNYVGEPHWPQKFKNKKDFQIRMSQFFAHYLKGEPMPVWMKEGVPVIDKEYNLGYKLVKE